MGFSLPFTIYRCVLGNGIHLNRHYDVVINFDFFHPLIPAFFYSLIKLTCIFHAYKEQGAVLEPRGLPQKKETMKNVKEPRVYWKRHNRDIES